jgi:hypothetical protein
MYGSEARVENPTDAKQAIRFKKRESNPETIKEISVAGTPVKWSQAGKYISFETELNPGETKTAAVTYKDLSLDGVQGEGVVYETKVMLRRHLCEVRDHILMPKKFST